MRHELRSFLPAAVAGAAILFLLPAPTRAHCDTADGPVVVTAKAALEKGDVTPVLKWVKPEAEKEIRAAFDRAVVVRKKGPEAKAMADDYFFESLVRIHREGEGAPYTGIKPAGSPVDPGVELADVSLEKGNVDTLAKAMAHHVDEGIRERFARTLEAKKQADESVEKGRAFVASYVDYVHYVERLHVAATTSVSHEGHAAASAHQH